MRQAMEDHTKHVHTDSEDTADTQSLPYVKWHESVSAVFAFDDPEARKLSLGSFATAATAQSTSPDAYTYMPVSLSYSVPSVAVASKTPRGRPGVDVIATYMNTYDSRSVKSDLLRAHAHFHGGMRSRSSSYISGGKEGSADWGWFADIDSSGESWGGGNEPTSLRRKLSSDLGLLGDVSGGSLHVLGDEQMNSRYTAGHKTFNIVSDDGNAKVVQAAISIPKFRIVQSRAGVDRHAQYLVTFKLGKDLFADWRRYSEFGELAKKLDQQKTPRSCTAWNAIETRWFNRLDPTYLHQKCISLEKFIRELLYESTDPTTVIEFLGGYHGKVNSRPSDPVEYRPPAQLPKELRPPQPPHERELFEKMWAENFRRSCVDYSDNSDVPTST